MQDAMQALRVRPVGPDDAGAIAAIYNHYVLNTFISFEEHAVAGADMAERIGDVLASGLPWLAASRADRVVGYAYAGKWKGRCAYRHSAESSVYVSPDCTGQGIGTALYRALLTVLRDRSIHVVIGGVALPNPASVALHERLAFDKVAHFKEVGYKFGRWIDVGYWQRTP